MRRFLLFLFVLLSTLSLADCGGGGSITNATVNSVNAASAAPKTPPNGGFQALVAFGGSLSDDGAYTPAAVGAYAQLASDAQFAAANPQLATQYGNDSNAFYVKAQNGGANILPFDLGGQFNINPGSNFITDIAQDLGLTISPYQVGYGYPLNTSPYASLSSLPNCHFSSALHNGQPDCLDFAQGGARVSDPNGIGHYTTDGSGNQVVAAMTMPLTEQIQSYLTQFKNFNKNQLITILAGDNDIFVALQNVGAALDQAANQAVTQALQQNPSLTADQQQQIAAQARNQAQPAAVNIAQAAVAQAADDLTGAVKTVLGKGGQYVVVYTLPDFSTSPLGRSLYVGSGSPPAGYVCNNQDPSTACFLLSDLVHIFNQRMLDDLQGQSVKVVDGFSIFNQMMTNPGQFGLNNITTPSCNLAQQPLNQVAVGQSILCNATTLTQGADPQNSWLFSDELYLTPAGYKILANQSLQAISSFGWLQ
jgi:phospholipase/lecithinase/hemolysin